MEDLRQSPAQPCRTSAVVNAHLWMAGKSEPGLVMDGVRLPSLLLAVVATDLDAHHRLGASAGAKPASRARAGIGGDGKPGVAQRGVTRRSCDAHARRDWTDTFSHVH